MSAFVIAPDTMSRAVRLIVETREPSPFGAIDLDTPTTNDASQRIGELLYTMNVKAVLHCCPDRARTTLPGVGDGHPADWRYSHVPGYSPIVGIKAAQCLRYQCSEGPVPGTPLFLELHTVIGWACEDYIGSLSRYDKAPWD